MTEAKTTPVHPDARPLPTARRCPFDPPEELGRLRAEKPVSRLSYPDGSVGWLVTGHAETRAVLADVRFSSRKELQKIPVEWAGQMDRAQAAPGEFIFMDPPDHTKYRRILAGQFSVRRMRELTPWIERIAEEQLDELEAQGEPADLMRHYAYPIPSLAICKMIGVPYEGAQQIHRDVTMLFNFDATPEMTRKAVSGINGALYDLLLGKRAKPEDDLMSGLVTSGVLSPEEILRVVTLLLIGGFENTANMIGLGTFALLSHPDQLALLRERPELMDNAVEELMRYVTALHIGPIRVALEDLELGDELIRAGEVITLSLPAANRDPLRFEEADSLDVTRGTAGKHLAFGLGPHVCIGQQLARIEMQVAYRALLRRFPKLRLAVPADEISTRDNMVPYGVHTLPIAWR